MATATGATLRKRSQAKLVFFVVFFRAFFSTTGARPTPLLLSIVGKSGTVPLHKDAR
jgi:hypothetical protein